MNAAIEVLLNHLELDCPSSFSSQSLPKYNTEEFRNSAGSSVPKARKSDFVQMPGLEVNMLTSMKLNQTVRVRVFPHLEEIDSA